jgi:hypothetical protein
MFHANLLVGNIVALVSVTFTASWPKDDLMGRDFTTAEADGNIKITALLGIFGADEWDFSSGS